MPVSEKKMLGNVLMLLSNAFDPDPRVHREAKALVAAGYRVTILGWDRDRKSAPAETIDGIDVERIYVASTHGRGSSQMFFLLLFWMKALVSGLSREFDVVHAHDFDTLPLGYLLAIFKRKKLVYDSHESYVDMVHWLPKWIRSLILTTENYLMKRSNLVITVGDILREYLDSRGANNTCVVGNWQDPDKFLFRQQELILEKRRIGIEEGQRTVVFIANLGAERRIRELIEGVSCLPNSFLILGGNGPCAQLAAESAKKYDNIAYLGFVSPELVPFYTALSDIVFYGFDAENPNARFSAPNKLFECLAAGKAMITGNFGEIGRIVSESKCGIVIDDYSTSTIRQAIDSMTGDQLKNFGSKAIEICNQKYSWKVAEACLINKYEQLLQ